MKPKTAIIIGAGIGGLATAIKLARKGFHVTIFEKNAHVGGRCSQINREGHIFDPGPTMYLFIPLFEEFYRSIGENFRQHITLLPVDPIYQLNFPDNTIMTLTTDQKIMKSQLENLEPGSYANFKKFLNISKQNYQLAITRLINQDYPHALNYFTPNHLYQLLKHQSLFPHYFLVSRYFKHPHLRTLFTFQDSYLSLHPFHTQSIFSLFTYNEIKLGNFLPKGGANTLTQSLLQIASKYPIKIELNQPVAGIQTNRQQVISIKLQDGSVHQADYFVANADLSFVYQKLLPKSYVSTILKHKRYSCSVLAFHWALSRPVPELSTHNLFFSTDYRQGFDQVLNQPFPPQKPHFYIQAPTRTDPSRSPKNQDTLTVMIPINRLHSDHPLDWNKYAHQTKKYVISRLKQAGLGDIGKLIKFEILITPLDWQHKFNLTHGSVYGLDHNLFQLGYLRPKRQHHKYKNLFFVGSSTHPGSGLPTVLKSAEFTSQQILNTN